MVKLSQIQASNKQNASASAPRIAVFVGGTSGIGKITLAEIAKLGTDFKAYVIGRKQSEKAFKTFSEELPETTNIVWVEGEVSLLSEVKRTCDHIKTLESSVDLLFLTTGYAPFGGRENTSEGIDTAHALSFYSRICFVQNLIPLLRASTKARVISVHSGGFESARFFNVDDLTLEKPGAFGAMSTQPQMGILNTLTLERLAEDPENHSIVFMHSHPGIVRTGNVYRGWKEGSWGPWLMDPFLMLLAFSFEESAQRYLYQVTSGAFGGKEQEGAGIVGKTTRGEERGGLFLVSRKCDTVMNEKELKKLREMAGETVWEKVQEILAPYV